MKVRFLNRIYTVVFTEHAIEQMRLRGISNEDVIRIIESGTSKPKEMKGKYWVYKSLGGRKDNLICISISIEPPNLIVITTLVNWSPK